jgi:hypothetical protein
MPEQYAATDKRTGLEVAITGEFPPGHDDRIRIARTTTLFTRLMSTILSNTSESERLDQFMAIETQLEIAEALIRGDFSEVQRLLRGTMERMGITKEQLDELATRIIDEFGGPENIPPDLRSILDISEEPSSDAPAVDTVAEDDPPADVPDEAGADEEEDSDGGGAIELGPSSPS